MSVAAVVRKEFHQIGRDRRTLGVLVFLPLFLLLMFGYAVSLDVRNASLAIVDRFRHFLQSHAKLKRGTGVGALAHLVWHKADFYLTKIDELVESQEANDLIHEARALVFSRVFSDACRYGFSCRISTTDVASMRTLSGSSRTACVWASEWSHILTDNSLA